MLKTLKRRFTRLNPTSWHRRLVDYAYWGKARPKKACPYWWFLVPASPLAAGLKLLALIVFWAFVGVVIVVAEVIMHIILVGQLFLGRRPKVGYVKWAIKWDALESDGKNEFYTSRSRLKPYMIVLPLVAVTAILVTILKWRPNIPSSFTNVLVWVLVGVLLVTILGKSYTRIVHPWLRKKCPPIEWADTVPNEPTPAG